MELNLLKFIKKTKHYIIKKSSECTGKFKTDITKEYHVYLCLDKLETINQKAKKYKDRNYKTFVSTLSGNDAKIMAYDYIKKQKSLRPKPISKEDLYKCKMWAEAILRINKTELPHYLKLNEEPLSKILVRKCLNTV